MRSAPFSLSTDQTPSTRSHSDVDTASLALAPSEHVHSAHDHSEDATRQQTHKQAHEQMHEKVHEQRSSLCDYISLGALTHSLHDATSSPDAAKLTASFEGQTLHHLPQPMGLGLILDDSDVPTRSLPLQLNTKALVSPPVKTAPLPSALRSDVNLSSDQASLPAHMATPREREQDDKGMESDLDTMLDYAATLPEPKGHYPLSTSPTWPAVHSQNRPSLAETLSLSQAAAPFATSPMAATPPTVTLPITETKSLTTATAGRHDLSAKQSARSASPSIGRHPASVQGSYLSYAVPVEAAVDVPPSPMSISTGHAPSSPLLKDRSLPPWGQTRHPPYTPGQWQPALPPRPPSSPTVMGMTSPALTMGTRSMSTASVCSAPGAPSAPFLTRQASAPPVSSSSSSSGRYTSQPGPNPHAHRTYEQGQAWGMPMPATALSAPSTPIVGTGQLPSTGEALRSMLRPRRVSHSQVSNPRRSPGVTWSPTVFERPKRQSAGSTAMSPNLASSSSSRARRVFAAAASSMSMRRTTHSLSECPGSTALPFGHHAARLDGLPPPPTPSPRIADARLPRKVTP